MNNMIDGQLCLLAGFLKGASSSELALIGNADDTILPEFGFQPLIHQVL